MSARLHVTLVLAGLAALLVSAAPAGATTPVSKAQREVVVFSPGLAQGTPLERAFYDFVEFNAISLATVTLGTRYNAVHVVKGAAATRNGLASKLNEIASRTSIRAVDMVFVTHGLSNEVVLADGNWSMVSVRDRIRLVLSAADRAKLRMVFSTACFGAAHRTAWREAGFKTVSGSRQVYADSAASYLPFLSAWAVGGTFGASVLAANAAGSASTWDAAAAAMFFARGSQFATQVDSFRLTSGATGLTISTMP